MTKRGGPPDRATVKVFPPAVPVLAIVAGVLLQRRWPLSLLDLAAPARYWLGGAILLGAVLGLGLWSVVLFRRSGQSENPWKPTTSIVRRGPYRVTRNPMYLQMLIGCVGFAVLLSNTWILLLTPLVALVLQELAIKPEEAYLERTFGQEYLDYKAHVRRWL